MYLLQFNAVISCTILHTTMQFIALKIIKKNQKSEQNWKEKNKPVEKWKTKKLAIAVASMKGVRSMLANRIQIDYIIFLNNVNNIILSHTLLNKKYYI